MSVAPSSETTVENRPRCYASKIELPRPENLGGGSWILDRLAAITVILGKNGSGKSLLLRAWRDTDKANCHYVVPERTGDLQYQINYMADQLDPVRRSGHSTGNFIEQYRRQVVARVQAYFTSRGNYRGDGKAPGDPHQIEALLAQLLPDFYVELNPERAPPYTLTRTSDGKPVGDVQQISSGEAQLITIALDILTIASMWEVKGTDKRIMLIDEPDAHIHPDLQVRFADFVVRVASQFKLQVVIATHSTTFLAATGQFGRDDTSVIYLDRTANKFTASQFTPVLKELAACLGGHALMGPLFGVPLLLVEGDDDYRIWSQVPRHHVTSFAVIPCNGEEIRRYQKSLEKLFAVLRDTDAEPVGFALLDGDKPKPDANAGTPQKHVRFVSLKCHEAENLYLSDEVLAVFGQTWAGAVTAIKARASEFGDKATLLADCDRWDRKNVDLKTPKQLVEHVATCVDPKGVHWTIRVAQAIGKARPTGQLAEFLGDEVVDSLWGAVGAQTEAPS